MKWECVHIEMETQQPQKSLPHYIYTCIYAWTPCVGF